MSVRQLARTARAMVAPGKGHHRHRRIQQPTHQRFAGVGIENTEENRRAYRELRPRRTKPVPVRRDHRSTNHPPVDQGRRPVRQVRGRHAIPHQGPRAAAGRLPGELVTEAWMALRDRLAEYYQSSAPVRASGARSSPSAGHPPAAPASRPMPLRSRLLRGAAREQGLVPMVEPEVLMDGDHDIETCYEVTEVTPSRALRCALQPERDAGGTILKASMVVPGKGCEEQASVEEVAESTLMCLKSRRCRRSCRASCSCPAARRRGRDRTSTR